MNLLKKAALLIAGVSILLCVVSCQDTDKIKVYTRENGSGTRTAFIELFEIEEKGENGERTDKTTKRAVEANQTGIMIESIKGAKNGIGYISLGSMNESVKALQIDGINATSENVKNNSYKIFRTFYLAVKKDKASEQTQDFINFCLSKEGQEVVGGKGYVEIDDTFPAFAGGDVSGKIVISGSSSVSPCIEKLIEEYNKINKNLKIELQTNDSGTGLKQASDGTCDIGMASRDLKEAELEKLTPIAVALDGVVIIVNKDNKIDNLTKEQIKEIFIGNITSWNDIK